MWLYIMGFRRRWTTVCNMMCADRRVVLSLLTMLTITTLQYWLPVELLCLPSSPAVGSRTCGWHDLWGVRWREWSRTQWGWGRVATRWPLTSTYPMRPSRGQRTRPWFGLTDSCQSESGCPCPRARLISGQANHSHLDQLHEEKCTSALRMCNFVTAGYASQEVPVRSSVQEYL